MPGTPRPPAIREHAGPVPPAPGGPRLRMISALRPAARGVLSLAGGGQGCLERGLQTGDPRAHSGPHICFTWPTQGL